MKKKILIALPIIFVLIQFVRIDKTNPKIVTEKDFITVENPPKEVADIIKTSCYDCHSNETIYPWYSNVAPVSWFLKHHINDAREYFNFSEWKDISTKEKKHLFEEASEEVEKGDMPMFSYLLMHSEAKLSKEQKDLLIQYFESKK